VGELSDGLICTLETVFERADHDRCAPVSSGNSAGSSPPRLRPSSKDALRCGNVQRKIGEAHHTRPFAMEMPEL
jgi:hypothetical protein